MQPLDDKPIWASALDKEESETSRSEFEVIREFDECLNTARTVRKLFEAYVDAGFSEHQALEIIKAMIFASTNMKR